MTTQGESSPSTAGPHAPAQDARRKRSEKLLLAGLALAAVGISSVVMSSPAPHPVAGSKSQAPAAGVAPVQALTEAQVFTADWYFPRERGIDQDNVKARRTGGSQGANCADILRDKTQDVLHGANCQGYLTVGFTSLDGRTLSSVTLLRFTDAGAAGNAVQLLKDKPEAIAFVPPDGTPPLVAAAWDPKLATTRVEQVGHYLALTASRYADGHTPTEPEKAALDATNRAVAFTAQAPFMWL